MGTIKLVFADVEDEPFKGFPEDDEPDMNNAKTPELANPMEAQTTPQNGEVGEQKTEKPKPDEKKDIEKPKKEEPKKDITKTDFAKIENSISLNIDEIQQLYIDAGNDPSQMADVHNTIWDKYIQSDNPDVYGIYKTLTNDEIKAINVKIDDYAMERADMQRKVWQMNTPKLKKELIKNMNSYMGLLDADPKTQHDAVSKILWATNKKLAEWWDGLQTKDWTDSLGAVVEMLRKIIEKGETNPEMSFGENYDKELEEVLAKIKENEQKNTFSGWLKTIFVDPFVNVAKDIFKASFKGKMEKTADLSTESTVMNKGPTMDWDHGNYRIKPWEWELQTIITENEEVQNAMDNMIEMWPHERPNQQDYEHKRNSDDQIGIEDGDNLTDGMWTKNKVEASIDINPDPIHVIAIYNNKRVSMDHLKKEDEFKFACMRIIDNGAEGIVIEPNGRYWYITQDSRKAKPITKEMAENIINGNYRSDSDVLLDIITEVNMAFAKNTRATKEERINLVRDIIEKNNVNIEVANKVMKRIFGIEYKQASNLYYPSSNTKQELENMGAETNGNNVILYRGADAPLSQIKKLRYNDYLSTVKDGVDSIGNAGASSYGKNVVKFELPISDVNVLNGEVQYKGKSSDLESNNESKYTFEIYRAFNDVEGFHYSIKEIDNERMETVRGTSSMGLTDGHDEFERLMKNKQWYQELKNNKKASFIDYPRKDLPSDLWDKKSDGYKMKPSVKKEIMDITDAMISKCLNFKDNWMVDLISGGSTLGNFYNATTDIDIKVVANKDNLIEANSSYKNMEWIDIQKDIVKKFREDQRNNDLKVGKRPLDFYIYDEEDILDKNFLLDYDAIYSIMHDKWIKGPLLVDINTFDRKKFLEEGRKAATEWAKKFDVEIGDIKRNIKDYEVVKEYFGELTKEEAKEWHKEIDEILEDITNEIKEMNVDKDFVVDARHAIYKDGIDAIPGLALNSMNTHPKVISFKLLQLWNYFSLCRDLSLITGDEEKHIEEVTEEDIPEIKEVIKKDSMLKKISSGSDPCIYVVRHADTNYNTGDESTEKIRGWIDIELNDKGKERSKLMAENFKGIDIYSIFTSDLIRATETAGYIQDIVGIDAIKCKMLRPWNLGIYQGEKTKEVFPEIADYAEHEPNKVIKDGESFNQFKKRLIDFMNEVINIFKEMNKSIILVTHYRDIKLLQSWANYGADGYNVDINEFLSNSISMGEIFTIKVKDDKIKMKVYEETEVDG